MDRDNFPDDYARCGGQFLRNGSLQLCPSRDSCLRYLARETGGSRAVFLLGPPAEECGQMCDAYWKQENGSEDLP